MDIRYVKLEIFIPKTHLSALRTALQTVDAGHLGNYDSCFSYSRVTGTWRTLSGASPYIGDIGTISEEDELKVEVRIASEKLDETLDAIHYIHPYETPVIFVIPLLV